MKLFKRPNYTPTDIRSFIHHLRIEAVALAALMFTLTHKAGAPLWIPIVAFPVFDIGMIGYVANPQLGAFTYNLMHNATFPTLCVIYGVMTGEKEISVIGYAWNIHIAVDRILGYGLKHKTSFYYTHLGRIGKKK